MKTFTEPEYGTPFTCLSVAELISLLSEMPQDLPVNLEGCDCWGWAMGVKHSPAEIGTPPHLECVDICRSEEGSVLR